MHLADAFFNIMVTTNIILGMYEYDFFTTVFAVSRALGCLTNGIWSRAYGLPI